MSFISFAFLGLLVDGKEITAAVLGLPTDWRLARLTTGNGRVPVGSGDDLVLGIADWAFSFGFTGSFREGVCGPAGSCAVSTATDLDQFSTLRVFSLLCIHSSHCSSVSARIHVVFSDSRSRFVEFVPMYLPLPLLVH